MLLLKNRLALIMCFAVLVGTKVVAANNVLTIVKGEIVSKTKNSILIKSKKSGYEEVGISNIGSVMVLDGRKLLDGWQSSASVGGGTGLGLSMADGNSPRNLKQSSKFISIGASLGLFLRVGYNFLTQKPPILIFDYRQHGGTTQLINRLEHLPNGAKVRITCKNGH